jgi:hypothetical protein
MSLWKYFSFLTGWSLAGCRAYLPANAGSRTINAAIQKAAQIKKFLVSIMLVFMCVSQFISLPQLQST